MSGVVMRRRLPAGLDGAMPPAAALQGVVSRPPRMAWDGRRYTGPGLARLDDVAARAMPGVVDVVRIAHFVGVVAVSAVLARQAAEMLAPQWRSTGPVPATPPEDAPEAAPQAYTWQLPAHPCVEGLAVTAWCVEGYASVWLPGGGDLHETLRAELACLLDLPGDRIHLASAGSCTVHDLDVMDAAADAALLSRAVGRPVRISLQRPAEAGTLSLTARHMMPDARDPQAPSGEAAPLASESPPVCLHANVYWGVRPSLARLLARPAQAAASAQSAAQGDYAIVSARTGGALAHASRIELGAMQVFAQESLLDEAAARLGADPLAHRLSVAPPGPERELAQRLAEQSGWQALASGAAGAVVLDARLSAQDGTPAMRGRGYASAHVRTGDIDGGTQDSWSAWVVEVAVEPDTGRVDVTRLVVGHDSQHLRAAQGAAIHEQHPQLLDSARRLLGAPARFDDWGATAAGGAAPLALAEVRHETVHARLDERDVRTTLAQPPVVQGQLAADGVLTLPAAAAIANAIFDATGVRLRQVPFNSEQLRQAMLPSRPRATPRAWYKRGGLWLAAGAGAVASLVTMAWPGKPAIAPTDGPDVSLYSDAAIERGRLVAAAGDCVVCHTAPKGEANAGGLGLETPFGTIYTTNITPDNDTGIGRWSFSAFDRAMREGVHRDGRQLYPAFPYTAFAKLTDADMQALYAYLMVQPPVRSEPPKTELAFPYSLRPTLAGWNLLFHDNAVYQPDPTQSLAWNRGAYLVEGAGHCAACHSPRNALGAEKRGLGSYLAGGEAEGWTAPALNQLASGATPWTADELFQYLRTGYSARHGVAAGPMAPVIHGLAELPESDVRAIMTYLLDPPGGKAAGKAVSKEAPAPVPATAAATDTLPAAVRLPDDQRLFVDHANGERIYQNACAACHEAGSGPTLFGVKPSLASNPNLHAATPDNLLQVVLHGIQQPANEELGYMPGFKDSLDDKQVQDLLGYLRARFAPQAKPWRDTEPAIDRIRKQAH
ncbi:Putative diheme cytochrome c-553 [plant metagenome]|uniref:Diheme cytochrome c-553 n=1 Tax=plant metagenome TaxID=1297885 RepID=A0A484PAU0_9ZZZZ